LPHPGFFFAVENTWEIFRDSPGQNSEVTYPASRKMLLEEIVTG